MILVLMAGTAFAQDSVIGIYFDDAATICDADLATYVTTTVNVIAILPANIPAITAAEFRISNLPLDPACAILTQNWNTPLVIGTVDYGIALAFSPALPGPYALLGTLDIFLLDANCVGADHEVLVEAALDSGNLVVVDEGYNEHPAIGWFFKFNCTTGCSCQTATEESSWGGVKALY